MTSAEATAIKAAVPIDIVQAPDVGGSWVSVGGTAVGDGAVGVGAGGWGVDSSWTASGMLLLHSSDSIKKRAANSHILSEGLSPHNTCPCHSSENSNDTDLQNDNEEHSLISLMATPRHAGCHTVTYYNSVWGFNLH